MSAIQRLYEVRRRLDPTRQPVFGREHDELVGATASLTAGYVTERQNPYQLETKERNDLVDSCPCYCDGAVGPVMTLSNTEYVYRVSSIPALLMFARPGPRLRSADTRRIYRELLAQSNGGADWTLLEAVLEGEVAHCKQCTFWTTLEITSRTAGEATKRLGMAQNWVPKEFGVLLRMRYSVVVEHGGARVPTIVNGFDSPIFMSADLASGTSTGTAIDIRHPRALAHGADELVVGRVPVDRVEVLPVVISLDRDLNLTLLDGSSLWEELWFFYDRMARR